MAKLQVVGVVGCTGTGKTTLCEALASDSDDAEMISGDDFFLPAERCPRVDLQEIWKDGMVPEAFAEKTADTNVPASIDWGSFEAAVVKAIERGKKEEKKLILVENFLLCNSAPLLALLDTIIFLDHRTAPENLLMQRKWQRAHLGKKSYKDRGVSFQEYQRYWTQYVIARYEQHSLLHLLPPSAIILDCS